MSSSSSSSGIFLLAAALSAIFMGSIGSISVFAGTTAETVTFYRLFIGALLVGLLLLASGQQARLFVWPGFKVLITGFFLAGFVVFYIQAMEYTSMANAVMIMYLAPLTAAVSAHFYMGERLTKAAIGMIFIALFGFAMMMEFNFSLSGRAAEANGLLFALAAMLSYAAFMLINRVINSEIHVLTRSGYQMLAGALVMLPLMLLQAPKLHLEQWGWLAAAGIFPGFLAILLAVVALRSLPASTFGTIAYLEPITVVCLAWLLFDQTLNSMQLAGCGLILLAGCGQAYLMSRSANAHQQPLDQKFASAADPDAMENQP